MAAPEIFSSSSAGKISHPFGMTISMPYWVASAAMLFDQESTAGAGVMSDGDAPDNFGERQASEAHPDEKGPFKRRVKTVGKGFDRDIGDQEHGDGEGEHGSKPTVKRGVGKSSDVEQVIIGIDDALGADGPKADGG